MANNNVLYGFIGQEHLFATRVQEAGARLVMDMVLESANQYNQIVNALMETLAARTTIAQERIALAGSKTLQPLDEWGNPIPTRVSGEYTVAYPIQGGGDAFGDNRISRQLMTVGEVNRLTTEIFKADKDWILRHALGAILDNTTWTYNDKTGVDGTKGLGDLTIQPLANGDSVTYTKVGGVAAATDNHYMAQADAIDDTHNPFPTIKAELTEHPGNTGALVSYVASDLVGDIADLAELVEQPEMDIVLGSGSDRLTTDGSAYVKFGKEYIGKTKSGVHIVEAPIIPSSYMITVATGADPVLRMREYPAPGLQGLFTETHNIDGNLYVNRFLRYAGFGVRNRVGAVVTYVGGGSYTIPTNYSTPLSV